MALDLEAVRVWRPDACIALLEEHEYEGLEIPSFREDVAAANLPWYFAPIRDGGTPQVEFFEAWAQIGPTIRNVLRLGGRVMIHCRAGLGRTGLLAAALLVEFGEAPEKAIAAVRTARPNTIENTAQEDFVRSSLPRPSKPSRESQIRGAMFGAAIGDALGSAFEFVSAADIARAIGDSFALEYRDPLLGSLLHARGHRPGMPTDDTAMALSVAWTIANGAPYTAERFATAFLADLDRESGRFGTMFWDGAPGNSTLRAIRDLKRGADPATCGGSNDGGNGAAMRSHPIGFLSDRAQALEIAALQARITHGHPAAVESARAIAAIVHDAVLGLEPTVDVPYGINEPTFVAAWDKAHNGINEGTDILPEHLQNVAMSGWVTVATAHAIAYIFRNDPTRAIAAAAASGRDTDTVASIVGAIVGSRRGFEALPADLAADLVGANDVRDISEALVDGQTSI